MTKREREQVVELLRCAAEECLVGRAGGAIICVANSMGLEGSPVITRALMARNDILPYELRPFDNFDHERLLEAAARVEEGSWP